MEPIVSGGHRWGQSELWFDFNHGLKLGKHRLQIGGKIFKFSNLAPFPNLRVNDLVILTTPVAILFFGRLATNNVNKLGEGDVGATQSSGCSRESAVTRRFRCTTDAMKIARKRSTEWTAHKSNLFEGWVVEDFAKMIFVQLTRPDVGRQVTVVDVFDPPTSPANLKSLKIMFDSAASDFANLKINILIFKGYMRSEVELSQRFYGQNLA